jgi:hypothetical protein
VARLRRHPRAVIDSPSLSQPTSQSTCVPSRKVSANDTHGPMRQGSAHWPPHHGYGARVETMHRDAIGDLAPIEPLYIEVSEVEGRGTRTHWGTEDMWRCRLHTDWRGYDITESDVAFFEANGMWTDEVGGARGMYERESVETHAQLHAIEVELRGR